MRGLAGALGFGLALVATACADDDDGAAADATGGGTTRGSATSADTGSSDTAVASTGRTDATRGEQTGTEGGTSVDESTGGPTGPVHLQVLAINDFHGHLEPPPPGSQSEIWTGVDTVVTGGVAYLADDVARLRAEAEHTLVVSAGDLIGGSPLTSGLLHDEPTIEAMNLLGLDLAGVGNHEFDEGLPELMRMAQGGCHPTDGCVAFDPFDGADFQLLAANVFHEGTDETVFPGVAIREVDGIEVAFIGMTLENTPGIVTASMVEGLEFRDEVETVEALLPGLQARGIETFVVLLHEGGYHGGWHDVCLGIAGPIVAIAEEMPDAVDVIVTGHTHRAYLCEIDGIVVTSAASFGRLITDIDLEIDRETGDVLSVETRNVLVERDDLDATVADLVDAMVDLVAPIANAEVGTITEDILRTTGQGEQSPLGNVITDAQLASVAAREVGGAQIAFMNHGGIRADLVFAAEGDEAEDGIVTFGEVFSVHPFGNSVITMTLTGAQLHAILESQFPEDGPPRVLEVSSGFSYAYSVSAAPGDKIDPSSMTLGGEVIGPDEEVRVAVNDHVASGAGGVEGFEQGTNVLGGPVDVEALAAYLEVSSPLSAPTEVRVTELP